MEEEAEIYLHLIELLKAGRAPSAFSRILKADWSERSLEWLRKKGISQGELESASWRVFLLLEAITATASLVLALLSNLSLLILLLPGSILSLLLSVAFHNRPQSAAKSNENGLLRDSPVMVGCLSMSLQVHPSLEQALVLSSQMDSGPLSERLRRQVWGSSMIGRSSACSALLSFAASLSELNSGLRQALHLVVYACFERTREGMDRLLDKANALALAGVREAADKYVASLSMSTMVLFSLGILLPVMLFSLLPLMSLGSFSEEGAASSALDPLTVLLLLGIFPLASFAYARSILMRNPLRDLPRFRLHLGGDEALIILFLLVGLIAYLVWDGVWGASLCLLIAILPSSLLLLRSNRGAHRSEMLSQGSMRESISCLYQIGNRMLSGSSFQGALEVVFKERQDTTLGRCFSSLIYQHRLSGRRINQLMKKDGGLRETSPLIEAAYSTVAECAERDPEAAGRIALNMAQYLNDIQSCEAGIEERLKSVTDMMRSTSMLFGPIVFGITCGLFGLIFLENSEAVSAQLLLIVGVYLIELSFIVCYFTVFLQGRKSWKEVTYQFATRSPVSILVLIAIFFISQTGLTSLL